MCLPPPDASSAPRLILRLQTCLLHPPPAAPTSVAPVPSLGYPTTSLGCLTTPWDPVASPAAPCEIHDTTMSSGPSHYPPTSLLSDPTSPITCPALPHAFCIPLPTCTRSRSCSSPAVALLRFASCSFPPFGFLLISFYVLYLIRVTLYIRPRLQVDPYPFLFGSPASTAFRSASHSAPRPTAVALTPSLEPHRNYGSHPPAPSDPQSGRNATASSTTAVASTSRTPPTSAAG